MPSKRAACSIPSSLNRRPPSRLLVNQLTPTRSILGINASRPTAFQAPVSWSLPSRRPRLVQPATGALHPILPPPITLRCLRVPRPSQVLGRHLHPLLGRDLQRPVGHDLDGRVRFVPVRKHEPRGVDERRRLQVQRGLLRRAERQRQRLLCVMPGWIELHGRPDRHHTGGSAAAQGLLAHRPRQRQPTRLPRQLGRRFGVRRWLFC